MVVVTGKLGAWQLGGRSVAMVAGAGAAGTTMGGGVGAARQAGAEAGGREGSVGAVVVGGGRMSEIEGGSYAGIGGRPAEEVGEEVGPGGGCSSFFCVGLNGRRVVPVR